MPANIQPSLIRPLRAIFWGAVIGILDFNITVQRADVQYRFDLINDTLGMVLIAWAVLQIMQINLDHQFRRRMRFVSLVAILAVLDTARSYVIMEYPPIVSLLFAAFELIALIAVWVFCNAMGQVSSTLQLSDAEQSWRTTRWLCLLIFTPPAAIGGMINVYRMITGITFTVDLGPLALITVPIFAIPLIAFFIATTTMMRQVRAAHQPNTA